MNAPRTVLLETLGIPDDPGISDDALAVTAAIYIGLAHAGRAATNAGIDASRKIITAAQMSPDEVHACKMRALKIWQEEI